MSFKNSFLVYFMFMILLEVSLQDGNKKQSTQTANKCGEHGDCHTGPLDCTGKCGCDTAYYYNETTEECVIMDNLMKTLIEKYDSEDASNINEGLLTRRVREEALQVFKGVLIAAVIFITSALVGLVLSCWYCCRINYRDRMLKNELNKLNEKIGRAKRFQNRIIPKAKPEAESCPMIIEETGTFIV